MWRRGIAGGGWKEQKSGGQTGSEWGAGIVDPAGCIGESRQCECGVSSDPASYGRLLRPGAGFRPVFQRNDIRQRCGGERKELGLRVPAEEEERRRRYRQASG